MESYFVIEAITKMIHLLKYKRNTYLIFLLFCHKSKIGNVHLYAPVFLIIYIEVI